MFVTKRTVNCNLHLLHPIKHRLRTLQASQVVFTVKQGALDAGKRPRLVQLKGVSGDPCVWTDFPMLSLLSRHLTVELLDDHAVELFDEAAVRGDQHDRLLFGRHSFAKS